MAHQATITNSYKECLNLLLGNAIKAKTNNVQFLMATMDIQHIQNDIFPLVEVRSSDLIKANVLPIYKEVQGGEHSEVELLSWTPNLVTKALLQKCSKISLSTSSTLFSLWNSITTSWHLSLGEKEH